MRTIKFNVSELIKPVIQNNKTYYEVQWKGYRETTLEPKENLLKDVAKMANQFEKKDKIKFYVNKNKTTKKRTPRFDYGGDD